MKYLSIILIVFITTKLFAQDKKGIHFEQGLTWAQVQAKAKAENKYIFLDCFATWCGPCKGMDRDVYTNKKVGEVIDSNFIAVKVQVDQTKDDNEEVKSWHFDAQEIQQQYKINAFPSFLFFSPDGKLVHRGLGYLNASDFITMVRDAMNPTTQYYTLLANYRNREKNYQIMPYLANIAKKINDTRVSNTIAQDYINNYLLKLKEEELYKRENIEFISSFIQSSNDKSFNLFYKYAYKVDESINKKNYSQNVVDYIITKEIIDPQLWPNNNSKRSVIDNPNWSRMSLIIKSKFNKSYGDRTVLNAKLRWFEDKKRWAEYCKNVINKVEKYGPYEKYTSSSVSLPEDWKLNANAWDLFLHSNEKTELAKALSWSDSAIKITSVPNVQYLDTHANLLYKIGRIQEAVTEEESAVKLEDLNAKKQGRSPEKIYLETVEKMQKGEHTWPIE